MTALYDYQPSRDSPNAYFDTELAFKAGDHITVYGNMVSVLCNAVGIIILQLNTHSKTMDFIVDNLTTILAWYLQIFSKSKINSH